MPERNHEENATNVATFNHIARTNNTLEYKDHWKTKETLHIFSIFNCEEKKFQQKKYERL